MLSHTSPVVDEDAINPDVIKAATDMLLDDLLAKADKRGVALDWSSIQIGTSPSMFEPNGIKVVAQAKIL